MAETLTSRLRLATYVWDFGDNAGRNFVADARTRIRTRADQAFGYVGGASIPRNTRILSAYLELVATEEWPGARTMTVRRIGPSKTFRQLTWNNRPAVDPAAGPVSVTQAGGLRRWRFDVTDDAVAAVTAGEGIRGWRIASSENTGRFFHGPQARRPEVRPQLVIVATDIPDVPTGLIPSTGAVSVSHPTLACDPPTQGMTRLQVQVDDADGAFTAPVWDSTERASTVPVLDLAGTGFGGLVDGDDLDWRIRLGNESGWGDWSPAASLTRVAHVVLTIISPDGPVGDGSPPVLWSVVGGVQAQYRVRLLDAATEDVLWGSGWVVSDADAAYPQAGLTVDGQAGIPEVSVRDTVNREATPGDPDYVTVRGTFTLDDDAPVGDLVAVVAAAHPAPWVDVRWQWVDPATAVVPDEWRVRRDGVAVATIPGADPLVWRDHTTAAHHTYSYQVVAIVNGSRVAACDPVEVTPRIAGVWLADPETGVDVLILGRDEVEALYRRDTEELATVGGTAPVLIYGPRYAVSGTVQGTVGNAYGRAGADELATLEEFMDAPAGPYRVAWADRNVEAALRDVQPVPRRAGTGHGRVMGTVTLGFQAPA